jgi:hypothetical protein
LAIRYVNGPGDCGARAHSESVNLCGLSEVESLIATKSSPSKFRPEPQKMPLIQVGSLESTDGVEPS